MKKTLNQSKSTLAFIREKENEIVIQSDKQSEINDVIYAEGNVSVSFRGKLLKADNLIYDKSNKEISATGNVILIMNDQVFKLSQLRYNFISKKGYLLDVKGSINTNTLMDDLSSNFSISDSNKIESLLKLEKKKFYILLIRLIIGFFLQKESLLMVKNGRVIKQYSLMIFCNLNK